jgi:REP element-mobilizing transposase RayT
MYNPEKHHRHSIRLKEYDYSQPGFYFVTICVQDRRCLFGSIVSKKMILNQYGKIINEEWQNMPIKYPHIKLHEYIIMPNHFHAIVEIMDAEGAGSARPVNINENICILECASNEILEYANNDISECTNKGRSTWQTEGQADPAPTPPTPAITIGNIIGYFKYQTTKKIDLPVKLWQRNYYESVIRNKTSYQNRAKYTIDNPKNWERDKFYGRMRIKYEAVNER